MTKRFVCILAMSALCLFCAACGRTEPAPLPEEASSEASAVIAAEEQLPPPRKTV